MQPQRGEFNIDTGEIEFVEQALPAPDLSKSQYDLFAGMPELWDYRKLQRKRRSYTPPKEQAALFSV